MRELTDKGVFGGHKQKRLLQEDSTRRFTTDPETIEDFAIKMDLTIEDAKFLVDELAESIRDIVRKNGECTIRKLGTFRLAVSKRSKMYVPKTGLEIQVPMRYVIKFTPSLSFKSHVNVKVKENIVKVHEYSMDKLRGN